MEEEKEEEKGLKLLKEKVEKLLEGADNTIETIFNVLEKEIGMVPFMVKEMAKKPEIFIPNFIQNIYVFRPKALDGKTVELISLAAASALRAEDCIDVHIDVALKEGATAEEIFYTIMISSIMAQTSVLASALRKYKEKNLGI